MDNLEKINHELLELDSKIYDLVYVHNGSNTVNECCYVCRKCSGGYDCKWANKLEYNEGTQLDGNKIIYCPLYDFDDYSIGTTKIDSECSMYFKRNKEIYNLITNHRKLLSLLDGNKYDTSKYRRW